MTNAPLCLGGLEGRVDGFFDRQQLAVCHSAGGKVSSALFHGEVCLVAHSTS